MPGPSEWTDAYFGDLYLRSVEDLLTPRLSALEAEAIAALLRLGGSERVLDLACGHGRHARLLAPAVGGMVGVDRSLDYLRRARRQQGPIPAPGRPGAVVHLMQGDVRALPFRSGAFDAAYSWYSSLFMFDDATNARALAEAARVLRPGGRLVVHHANPLRLALAPRESAARTLADGSRVEEESVFDAATGVDRCARRLVAPSGAVLAATAELRYYRSSEWLPLAEGAGLRLVAITSTPWAALEPTGELGCDAPDLVAVLERPPLPPPKGVVVG